MTAVEKDEFVDIITWRLES